MRGEGIPTADRRLQEGTELSLGPLQVGRVGTVAGEDAGADAGEAGAAVQPATASGPEAVAGQ